MNILDVNDQHHRVDDAQHTWRWIDPFITSIDLDFTILLAPVVAWIPVFKIPLFLASCSTGCKAHSKILLPSPKLTTSRNTADILFCKFQHLNINASVRTCQCISDYQKLSAQSPDLKRFASNSFCSLKSCMHLWIDQKPSQKLQIMHKIFHLCNLTGYIVEPLFKEVGLRKQVGQAPYTPGAPTSTWGGNFSLRFKRVNCPNARFMGANTFPSSPNCCSVCWSVCPPAAGCSTTGSSEPAASAILLNDWRLWNRIQSVIKGTAQEELGWRVWQLEYLTWQVQHNANLPKDATAFTSASSWGGC